jgi:hypothetical protein
LALGILLLGPNRTQHWDASMSPQEKATFEKTVRVLGH